MDSMEISMDQTPQYSLHIPAFFGRPTGQGKVCTDENHAVIILRAKAGDYLASDSEEKIETFKHSEMRLLNYKVTSRAGQGKLPHLCHRHVNSKPAPAAGEYILTIPDTQIPASQVIQPTQQSQVATKGQQKPRGQPTSLIVVND